MQCSNACSASKATRRDAMLSDAMLSDAMLFDAVEAVAVLASVDSDGCISTS